MAEYTVRGLTKEEIDKIMQRIETKLKLTQDVYQRRQDKKPLPNPRLLPGARRVSVISPHPEIQKGSMIRPGSEVLATTPFTGMYYDLFDLLQALNDVVSEIGKPEVKSTFKRTGQKVPLDKSAMDAILHEYSSVHIAYWFAQEGAKPYDYGWGLEPRQSTKVRRNMGSWKKKFKDPIGEEVFAATLPEHQFLEEEGVRDLLGQVRIRIPVKTPEPEPEIPIKPEPIPEPKQPSEDTPALRVTEKYKNELAVFLTGVALASALGGLATHELQIRMAQMDTHTREAIEAQVDADKEPELAAWLQEMSDYSVFRAIDINLGDSVYVKDGQEFRTMSIGGSSKTMGEEFDAEGKQEGEYRVTGIAVIYDGQVVEYIEDFDGKQSGINVHDYVLNVCQAHGIDPNDVDIQIHLGVNSDNTRLGWIAMDDMFEYVQGHGPNITTTPLIKTVTGEFDVGDPLATLENGVQIPTINEEGKPISVGDVVIGNDGRYYKITDVQTTTIENEEGLSRKVVKTLQPLFAIGSVASVAALAALEFETHRRNKEAQKRPEGFDFKSEADMQRFVSEAAAKGQDEEARKEYEEKKNEYEETRRKFMDRFIKQVDMIQRYDPEQRKAINQTIVAHKGEVLAYIRENHGTDIQDINPKYIKLAGGKVLYLEFKNGRLERTHNITECVLPFIAQIGRGNAELTEGIITDEMRRAHEDSITGRYK